MNKLNKYLSFIFLLVAPYFCFAQDYWEIIDVPDTIQIITMAANNQNHIFLGTGGNGIDGGIYRSVDNCITWEYLIGNNHSNHIIHLNEYNHIFIDWHGDMYMSTDNGESWALKYDGMANITCIKSYPNGILFANSGTGSYISIIRSLDYGETWEEVLIFDSMVEFIFDFTILNEDTVYTCTTHYFDGGGIYRSVDGGDAWDHIGMYDFHCKSLANNSNGDIFVGTYGHNTQYWLSGVYVLYNGDDEWIQLYSTLVNDMAVNSDDHLFVATDYGILESTDNGQTFEYINEGLFTGDVDDLAIDSSGFLYASSYNPCNMARSLEPTITGINKFSKNDNFTSIDNYPNPFTDKTTISFTLPDNSSNSVLQIYNIHGKVISEFTVNGKNQQQWDGRDNNGNIVHTGVFLYRIKTRSFTSQFHKLLFIH